MIDKLICFLIQVILLPFGLLYVLSAFMLLGVCRILPKKYLDMMNLKVDFTFELDKSELFRR